MRIQYPMTFMISNAQMGLKTYCGVLEFSAEEGMCHIPIWMMNNLCVQEGSEIILRNMNLKKGSYVKIRPHETAFIELSNPKAILEQELTFYSVLHKGDTINIQYGGRDYAIDIMECQPNDQICCVDTNIELDFEAPKDYVEPPKLKKQTTADKNALEAERDAAKLAAVAGKYTRIDGKQLTDQQKRDILNQLKAQEKAEKPDFDPRKHRLQHGIRNFVEAGQQAHLPGSFAG